MGLQYVMYMYFQELQQVTGATCATATPVQILLMENAVSNSSI